VLDVVLKHAKSINERIKRRISRKRHKDGKMKLIKRQGKEPARNAT